MLAELTAVGADDTDINKITWQNACNVFSWDPFARTPREQASVAALRAKATDVDVSIRPRKERAQLHEQKQIARRQFDCSSSYFSAIESPCTTIPLASIGRLAGPLATVPSRLKLLPWQGQLIDAPTTSATVHPACVQMAEKPLNFPCAG